jgi:hypothetical protein
MLRIEKLRRAGSTILRLSGRIEEGHLAGLQAEIKVCSGVVELDLHDTYLLDRATIQFLIQCEADGVRLVNCPLYIQEWILRERDQASSESDDR